MKRLLILCLAIVILSSCKNKLIQPYHGINNIHFVKSNDSLVISFGLVPNKKDSLVRIPVWVTGKVVNYDREYKVKILKSSTAKKGINFSFYKDDFTIDAGKFADSIKIKLNNPSNLNNSPVFVSLKLLPNKYFRTKLQSKVTNSGDTLNLKIFKLYASDIVKKPNLWIFRFFGISALRNFY